jgi:hypothetical protein
MQWSDIPRRPAPNVLRQFAALCSLACAIAAASQWWRGAMPSAAILAGVGIGVGMLGAWKPAALRPVFVGAMIVTFPIGWLVLNAGLAVVFFGLVTPIAVWFRLRGRDALRLKRPVDRDSYFDDKPGSPIANYYRTF